MIRTFQVSDIFLAQRILRQSVRLNPAQSLLNPRPPIWRALLPTTPLDDAKLYTYILDQRENSIARAGLLQAQKRPGRPEADITLLAPRLDAKYGHPAIWQKLLSHFSQEAITATISRVYVTAPDEPTLVRTLESVGFRVYARQTIWRLASTLETHPHLYPVRSMRLQTPGDEWGLMRLYAQSTPRPVQLAEGAHSEHPVKPPILDLRMAGVNRSYVRVERDKVVGCVQIGSGPLGGWIKLWVDTRQPASERILELVSQGVAVLREQQYNLPIYIGVDDYQGGVASVLVDSGFAPFTDMVKAMRPTVQHVRQRAHIRVPVLEAFPTVASAPYHRQSYRAHAEGTRSSTPTF